MRREFIYPHRSVRSLPVSRARLLAALGVALLLSVMVWHFSPFLLENHTQASSFILRGTGVPISGAGAIEIFPRLGTATVPIVPFQDNRKNPLLTGLLLAAFVAGIAIIRHKIPLSRNFLVFLMIIVGATTIAIIIKPPFDLNSAQFQKIWLGGEILVWIVLPWVSVFLFMLTLPSLLSGAAWTVLTSIYAMLWSVLRLSFCLGILHYTGVLFLPLLWFSLGILFDLVYVLFFYSVALRLSMRQVSGKRAP